MEDSIYWHCYRKITGIGQTRLRSLMRGFPSGEEAWSASSEALQKIGVSEETTASIIAARENIEPELEAKALQEMDIRIMTEADDDFPTLLRETPFPVAMLYARGNFDEWNRPMVAIVGSRRHTAYGRQAAERIAEDLARAGVTVVSGLAYGIDSVAHGATLNAGGATIAVLGGGIDDASIHPREHLPLATRVIGTGALLSEYPPGTSVSRGTFPARNRIIAALSAGTIVVEAAEKSGSLITADHALECGREVFAVPGPIFSPASGGTNRLIQKGAKLVRGVGDILEELPLGTDHTLTSKDSDTIPVQDDLSPEETKVLSLLSHEATHVDQLIKHSHLDTASASSALTMLEVKGLAKNIGGMNYIRS
jgi:DNA processing protein